MTPAERELLMALTRAVARLLDQPENVDVQCPLFKALAEMEAENAILEVKTT